MLTSEQIKNDIPRLMNTHTNQEIGKELGVSKWVIEYWIKQLRKKGYELPLRKGKGRPPRI
jgi:transposase